MKCQQNLGRRGQLIQPVLEFVNLLSGLVDDLPEPRLLDLRHEISFCPLQIALCTLSIIEPP